MKSISEHITMTAHHFAKTTIIALLCTTWVSQSSQAQDADDKRAIMFERGDLVNLEGKGIPDLHKRTQITDIQSRSIKGEWIAIDRKSQKVKFRRTDGKEFDISMANLAPSDRRYAELETGILWQLDPPPTEIGIIQEEILGFESMDEKYVHFHVVNVKDPSVPTRRFYRIDQLTEKDRLLIKQKTGRELVVLPNSSPDKNNPGLKHNSRLIFGHEVPEFKASYYPATIELMGKTYSPQEIVDAVRTRTMTGAFIHEYYNSSYEEAQENERNGTKSLAKVLEIIGDVPSPPTEVKSIKPLIAKHKLTLYEEKVPRDPAEPQRFIKGDRSIFAQPGVPIDGELQAIHYMCQFHHLSANKPKVSLVTLLENTKQNFTGMGYTSNGQRFVFPTEQRRKIYHSPDVAEGIEKSHGYTAWKIFVLPRNYHYHRENETLRKFFITLNSELIRKHIRDGKPVYARKAKSKDEEPKHGTQLVITGFKAEQGKPLMLECISIKGSIYGNDSYTGEYEIKETTLLETELDGLSVVFLEAL